MLAAWYATYLTVPGVYYLRTSKEALNIENDSRPRYKAGGTVPPGVREPNRVTLHILHERTSVGADHIRERRGAPRAIAVRLLRSHERPCLTSSIAREWSHGKTHPRP